MPTLGSRKDEALRTYPVSFSLPKHLIDELDAQMAASGQTSRSKMLVEIITFWLENKPKTASTTHWIEEDLDRFRNFVR